MSNHPSFIDAIHSAIVSYRFVRLLESITGAVRSRGWCITKVAIYPEGPCAMFVKGGLTVSLRFSGPVPHVPEERNRFYLLDEASELGRSAEVEAYAFHALVEPLIERERQSTKTLVKV